MKQRIVLIGGGHAHVQVIKALNKKSRPKNLHVTLIDMANSASYSGMVPGCIAKYYQPKETLLELEPLAKWAGIEFINNQVIDMDLQSNKIILKENSSDNDKNSDDNNNKNTIIPFDVVSIDVGSTSRGIDDIDGAKKYTIPTRPISDLIRKVENKEKDLLQLFHQQQKQELQQPQQVNVVVVGGGAAGIELSFSIKERWKNFFKNDNKHKLTVTLLDSGTELLPNESFACRSALRKILQHRGISVRHNCNVETVTSTNVCLSCGHDEPYTVCLWATGASAQSLEFTLGKGGLDITNRGWIRVNKYLQSTSHPNVFAAGDCSSIEDDESLTNPPPKAGVYAVRSGPILIDNLTKFLDKKKKELTPYKPQDDFLKLLICGEGKALGFRFGIPLYGKWVFKLKDTIDQGFMDLFRKENLPADLSSSNDADDISSTDDDDDDDEENGSSLYDRSEYDATFVSSTGERLNSQDASFLLQRTDDDVNYEEAWKVIRDMAQDESYRKSVKDHVGQPTPLMKQNYY